MLLAREGGWEYMMEVLAVKMTGVSVTFGPGRDERRLES